jgi:hypothetical protein
MYPILILVGSFADIKIYAKTEASFVPVESSIASDLVAPSDTSEDVAHFDGQGASSSIVAQSGKTFKYKSSHPKDLTLETRIVL